MTRCDVCGLELHIGDFPFCPHGQYRGGVQPDSFGSAGMWVDNLGDKPVWVTGREDLRAKAAERGLRWAPEGVTTSKVLKRDDDMYGRYNGGAEPTFREHYDPAPTLPKGHPGPDEQH